MTKHEAKNERQQQIIQAALQCFASTGYASTTMDEIAEACGLSKGSLYRYYKNKKDLFLAIMQSYFGGFTSEVDEFLAEDKTQEAKLRHIIDLMNQVAVVPELQALSLISLDFYSQTRLDEEVNAVLLTMLQAAFDLFTTIIQEGIANGEFNPVNARHYALILMGIGDGLGIYQMINVPNFDYMGTMDTMLEMVWQSLLRKP